MWRYPHLTPWPVGVANALLLALLVLALREIWRRWRKWYWVLLAGVSGTIYGDGLAVPIGAYLMGWYAFWEGRDARIASAAAGGGGPVVSSPEAPGAGAGGTGPPAPPPGSGPGWRR